MERGIFHKWKEEDLWKQGSFDGEKGEQMKGFEKMRNDDLLAVFQLESAEIPEYKMGQQMRIWDRGLRPTRDFKSQQFLVIKFVPWWLKKDLSHLLV